MEKEKIIEEIIRSESFHPSKELLTWIRQSAENQGEYVRYKNIWALLQQGKEMDEKDVAKDYQRIKARIKSHQSRFNSFKLLKYAAVITFALIAGYLSHSINGDEKVAMNEISVPNGNRSLIVLPDGSKVWLTNGSKLIYPENFEGKTRNVKLEGEAFFTVTSNKKRPFILNIGEHRIEVLGTEFSVVSYPDDDFIHVNLVTGKVQIDVADKKQNGNYKSYMLQPLHRLVLNKASGNLTYSEIPDSFYKYWKEGIYEFKNESFESLAKKIERIYSVKIIFEDTIVNHRTFTGAFHIDSNIYTIMETFKRACVKPFEYSIDKNRIYLKSVK